MGIRVCDNNALDSDEHSRIDRFFGIVDMGGAVVGQVHRSQFKVAE